VLPVAAEGHAEGDRHQDQMAAVEALNDPAVKKQLENLGLQMPPKGVGRRCGLETAAPLRSQVQFLKLNLSCVIRRVELLETAARAPSRAGPC
jgi:hypothetical protein